MDENITKRVPVWEDFDILQDKNFTLESFRQLLDECMQNAALKFRERGWKGIQYQTFSFDTEFDRDAGDDYKSNIRATLSLCFYRDETKEETDRRLFMEVQEADYKKKMQAEQEAKDAFTRDIMEKHERETYERLRTKYEKEGK